MSNKWIFVVSKFYATEWVKDLLQHDSMGRSSSIQRDEQLSWRAEDHTDRKFGAHPVSCGKESLVKVFTTSDKAFVVMVVDIFYERWKKEGELKAKGQDTNGENLPPP